MNDTQVTETLYGDSAQPNAQQPDAQQPGTNSTDTDLAAVLYPEDPELPPVESVPDAVKELRVSDRDRVVFGAQQTYADVPTEDVFSHPDINDTDRARVGAEVREMFMDNGLTPLEAQQVLDIAKDATTRPDADTATAWATEAHAQLKERYGDEAPQMLDLARKLVARDPRTAAILEQSGLGNHPRMVMLAVEAARRAQARGQI